MKKILRLIVIALIVSSGSIFAQNFDGYEQYVNNAMKDWNVQGCSVVIVKNGKVLFVKGFGYRDVKNQLPVTANTLFAIGSCTKAFTSADINLLVEDGKIDLDKPVISYFPSFKLYDEYTSMHVTARDLLCHRTGLPRHDLAWYGADNIPRKDMITRMQYLEPSAGFREKWQYQNGMYAVLGYIVEIVNGTTWEDFTKSRILNPLGMTNTNFSVIESQKSTDYSKPYDEKNDVVEEIPFRSIDAVGPAGSINSSAADMANWVMMQLNGGKFNGKQIISESSVNAMQSPQMIVPSGTTDELFYSTYGMGWMITSYRGHLRIEHGGNIDGFSASVCMLPKDSAGVVVLTNMNGTGLPSVIRNYSVDKILGLTEIDWNKKQLDARKKSLASQKENENKPDPNRVEGTSPSHELESYTGKFSHPAYGNMNISLKGNQLEVDFNENKIKLEHYHYDIFQTEKDTEFGGIKLTFLTNAKGEIYMITVPLQDGVKDIEFKRVVEIKEVNKTDLTKYLGEYEISGVIIKVTLRGENTLMLTVPGQPDYELLSTDKDSFNIKNLDGYSVKFNSEKDVITEVVFNQPNGVFTAKKK